MLRGDGDGVENSLIEVSGDWQSLSDTIGRIMVEEVTRWTRRSL